jgi:tetratricopeptide (TPR) repeat protein
MSEPAARRGRIAILWRGDEAARRSITPETSRFRAIFAVLADIGIDAEPVVYEDDVLNSVRAQLATVDGVLVWVNPIHEGRNRANLDALLREVAARGVWVSAHGRTADANALLQQAVKQKPGDRDDAWHNLGLCHLDGKEYAQARACFLEVYRIDQSDGFAVCRLIELAALAGDLQDAEHWCDVLSALPDGTVAAIAFRARALNSCGRAQDAWRLLNEGLVAHPEKADLLIAFGDIASMHNHYKPAAESYERAVTALRKSPHHVNRLREIERRLRMVRQELSKSR